MVEIVIGLQKGHVICPKTMVEIVIGLQKGHMIFLPKNYGGVSNWFSE